MVPCFSRWNLEGARVLYRIDANISFSSPNHRRLRFLQKTLCQLISAGASVTILAHRGRPRGYTPDLTLKPLVDYCSVYGFVQPQVVVAENVRFDVREYSEDCSYARFLKADHTFYLTDAWASFHKPHTSIVTCAELFPREARSIGNLVFHEIMLLAPLRDQQYRRCAILLGGGKVFEKIKPIIRAYNRGIRLLICIGPGGSYDDVQEIVRATGCDASDILFYAGDLSQPSDLRGLLPYQAEQFFHHIVTRCDTVFITGPMGVGPFRVPYEKLLALLERSACSVIVGGGGTSELYDQLFPQGRAAVSTGGGATLAYICGDALPGLIAIEETSACL
jgi:phosphoglycerate kinase